MEAHKEQLKFLKLRRAELNESLKKNKEFIERAEVTKKIKAVVDILTGENK